MSPNATETSLMDKEFKKFCLLRKVGVCIQLGTFEEQVVYFYQLVTGKNAEDFSKIKESTRVKYRKQYKRLAADFIRSESE